MGKTDAKGRPKLLQAAVIGRKHLDDIALAKPPVAIQRLVFGILAPLGRLLGYRARLSAFAPGDENRGREDAR